MAKPATLDGYSDQYTLDCEHVLVTPMRGSVALTTSLSDGVNAKCICRSSSVN